VTYEVEVKTRITKILEDKIAQIVSLHGYYNIEELMKYLLHCWYEDHREKEAEP